MIGQCTDATDGPLDPLLGQPDFGFLYGAHGRHNQYDINWIESVSHEAYTLNAQKHQQGLARSVKFLFVAVSAVINSHKSGRAAVKGLDANF